MNLPQPESLAASIGALPSSRKAIKALNGAAEQIQLWTKRALKVLENLDADEDVEWAAAAGRDGLDETEKTIHKFENLVNVYVVSIEELQTRPDIAEAKTEELQGVVEQMEIVLDGWGNVRKSLKDVRLQVELAMEWEELWSTILQEVGAELDSLSSLIFDMEEKRHIAYTTDTQPETNQTIDLNELESFIDEPRGKQKTPNSRFSLPPPFDSSPLGSPIIENPTDDSNLLALFARMQPLRASLDFLPMRLSLFQNRAEKIFPAACSELDDKKLRLERNWTDLSKSAENLRQELSEDRWVIVFRNAGRQAQKMCESVERSVVKVQEAINEGFQRTSPGAFGKRIESFEAKKMHYAPAITRVLGIIQKGLKDRLTVNGEILRLHKDLSSRMRDLTDAMDNLENILDPVASKENSRLRESISSIVSADRSFSSTTMAGTPGSSPASSVDFANHQARPKYGLNGYSKPRASSATRPPLSSANKRSGMIQPRRPATPLSAQSTLTLPRRGASPLPGPPSVYRQGSYVPPTKPTTRPAPNPVVSKPRWSSTVRPDESGSHRSVSSTTPVSFRKYYSPRSFSSTTTIPLRSPLGRETSSSPVSPPSGLPTPSTARHDNQSQHFKSFAERVASPTGPGGLLDPVPYHRGRNASAPQPGTIRSPSAMAIHGSQRPTKTAMPVATPPSTSALSRSTRQALPPRISSLNARMEQKHVPEEGYLPANDPEQENRSDMDDGEELDQLTEPGSSPLSRKTVTRPGSVAASSRGKRMSMLPLPVGGRTSSLGHRAA
jgi:Yeast cortical protein KAR9